MKRFLHAAAIGAAFLGAASAAPAANPDHPFVPVLETDFPDPHIVEHKGEFLAYSTNSGGINLPVASSRDLVTWTTVTEPGSSKRHDAMPKLAPWVKEGRTWAPEVMAHGNRWLLYYTAHHGKKNRQCVGVAVAKDPRGPFVDASSQPLVCQDDEGGSIDASPFRDADGQLYLYFKNDGNAVRKTTQLWAQRLAPDGMSTVGAPVALAKNDKKWEAHVVESPTMVKTPSGYTLLYSANHYGWETHQRLSPYAMGYALCEGPMGPCRKAGDPVLYSYNDRSVGCLSGPGHQTVFQARGRAFIAFHAWAATPGCRKLDNRRYMYIAPLGWKEGKPVIAPSLRRPK